MLGMDIKAQILILSVSHWTIQNENKSGYTLWSCMSESSSTNKKGFEPVKQSLSADQVNVVAPILGDVKLPCICDCTFTIVTGGQSAKPVLKSIDKVVKSLEF